MKIRKLIIAPDSFKGTLSSQEVAGIIAKQAALAFPDCELALIPIADGGEGSVDTIYSARGGKRISAKVLSPDERIIYASYLLFEDSRAALELAQSSGYTRQKGLHPMTASTYGFGQLILDAVERGACDFTLCIGGSASTDGGCGMAAALGVRFLDSNGRAFVPCGETLCAIKEIDTGGIDARLRECRFTVMCDVKNPLYGSEGAAYCYAPQKGANSAQIKVLDDGLRTLGDKLDALTGDDISLIEGGGAAGGLGAGCVAFLGARLTSGIDAMLALCGYKEHLVGANAVFTGEGKLDEQSLMGKVLSGIIRASDGMPIISVCGVNRCDNDLLSTKNVVAFEAAEGVEPEECMAHPDKYVALASARAMEYLKNVKE